MIGVGLGGFMDGWNKMGEAQLADKRRALADQQAARQKTLDQREDAEYNRTLSQRNEIDAINTRAKQEFDARVSAGTEKPENYDQFWNGYALPMLKKTYLSQNNIDMANKVQAWGETEDARAGAKFFMGSLAKLKVGDYAGAIDDAIAGSKRKGYLSHDFDITGYDSLFAKEGGPTIGYRFNYKKSDGSTGYKDVPLPELGQFIAGIGNPKTAWESQVAAQQDLIKRKAELEDYEKKKQVDQKYGVGADQKINGDVLDALRKRFDGEYGQDPATGKWGPTPKFDDLPAERRQQLFQEEKELRTGANQPGVSAASPAAASAGAGSGRKDLVDTATGRTVDLSTVKIQNPSSSAPPAAGGEAEPVKTDDAENSADEPGFADRMAARAAEGWGNMRTTWGNVLSGETGRAKAEIAARADAEQKAPRGVNDRHQPETQASKPAPGNRTAGDTIVARAEKALREGIDPRAIMSTLSRQGVPAEQWPDELRRLLANEKRGIGGLGR